MDTTVQHARPRVLVMLCMRVLCHKLNTMWRGALLVLYHWHTAFNNRSISLADMEAWVGSRVNRLRLHQWSIADEPSGNHNNTAPGPRGVQRHRPRNSNPARKLSTWWAGSTM